VLNSAAAPAPDGSLPSLGGPGDAAALPAQTPTAESAPTSRGELPMPPDAPGFAPALGAQLRTWLKDGIEHARLELHPRELGPIDVRIALQDGRASVSLGADLASTREALNAALPQLQAQLADLGLQVATAAVSDSPRAESGAPFAADNQARGGDANGNSRSDTPSSAGVRLAQAFGRFGAQDFGGDTARTGATRVRDHRGLLDLFA
jgi:flagellar hook-length control protein FliK